MGNFYVSVSFKGAERERLLAALAQVKDDIYISATHDDWVTIVSEALDTQDQSTIDAYGEAITESLGVHAVSVLNHDSDFLSVDVYTNGVRVGEYNSCPGNFNPDAKPEDLLPRVKNVEAFSELAREGRRTQVLELLQAREEFTDPDELHQKLVDALGLPPCSVGAGYRYVKRGECGDSWISAA